MRPSKSRFMGFPYTVTFQPLGTVKNDEGDGCFGTTDHNTHSIAIEDGLSHDKEREVVLHETIHQIFGTAGAGLDEAVEEQVCTLLGAALVGHMRDNPGFWRYLMQKPPKETK